MITLQFIWDQHGYYEDESENLEGEFIAYFSGETIEEACDEAADNFDWNDEDVYNFDAKSELYETSRDLKTISIMTDTEDWKEVKPETYEYYGEAEENAMKG